MLATGQIDHLDDAFYRDAITEVLNMGMGAAAASLSEMIGEEVELNVPEVQLLKKQQAFYSVGSQIRESLCGVEQRFNGSFWGKALILFSEEEKLELVKAVLRDPTLTDSSDEIVSEATAEIGNVILNSCISSFADLFQSEMTSDIPRYFEFDLNQAFESKEHQPNWDTILLLKMKFSVEKKNISGHISFLMDIFSIDALKQNIRRYTGME